MHPVLFKIGAIQVYSYGVMLALAFLAAAFLARRRASSLGMNGDDILDLCVWLIVSGLIGGRLLFVLLNLGYYRENPLDALKLWQGGLVWYGGLIAAIAAALIFLSVKKIPVLKTGDLMAPYVALGQSIGRIGCFLNGCCYGREISPGVTHPTQLYESAAMFAVFLILRRRTPANGRTLFLYLILYSCIRFLIEFLRGDNPAVLMGLTISQVISVIVLVTAGILWKTIPSK
jgi:phosphatidylglycerol:prolipoprotein diacylglycerol transferase